MNYTILTICFASILGLTTIGATAQDDKNAARAPGSVSTTVTLAGGLEVDIEVAFESVTNLSLSNVGISGSVIDPLDAGLLGRMPAGIISIPTAFPVLIDITPPAGASELEFEGLATTTLRTINLPYYDGIRLRLFSAHGGGDFADITKEVSQGSYRVRGSHGEFSEFLIVQEDRINNDVVNIKLAALQAELTAQALAIDPTLFTVLDLHLADVDAHWLASENADAIVDLDAFSAAIESALPSQITNTWAPSSGTNIAGVLRAMATTLRFSLATDPCPASGDFTDTDLDGVPDECDNCKLASNPDQCDGDGDGYGNHCDADLNNNNVVNVVDLGLFRSVYLSTDPTADLNCNGVVNVVDLGMLRSMYLGVPGPSGRVP